MSNIVDNIINSVCLDERISDGIFKMEEDLHMDALREFFMKSGLSEEDTVNISNRMLEGRFPERQAYNANGILVTFPTPEYKKRAIQKGTHFEKNPHPQRQAPPTPIAQPIEKNPTPPVEKTDDDVDDGGAGTKIPPQLPDSGDGNDVGQPKNLKVEPIGNSQPEPAKIPVAPPQPPEVNTPERNAAKKAVATQIFSTDDTTLSNIEPKVGISESCKGQLKDLFEKAESMSMYEAAAVLKSYLK